MDWCVVQILQQQILQQLRFQLWQRYTDVFLTTPGQPALAGHQ